MPIEIHADKTAIVLERVEGDASGNNDRQRLPLVRLTLLEAQALAEELDGAITAAAIAVAEERKARVARARAELEEAEAKAVALREEIRMLEAGSSPGQAPALQQETPPSVPVQHQGEAAAIGGPSLWTGDPVSAGAIDAVVLTAAASMVPTPRQHGVARSIADAEPEMPAFLRRTA